MSRNAKCIELRSAEGKLMFSLHVYDGQAATDGKDTVAPSRQSQAEPQRSPGADGQDGPSLMTDAQKKYLFRILAERGFEGDNAHQHLKDRFGVESLTEVTKREASSMIEQLLEEAESK